MRAAVTTGEYWIFFAYKRSASARSGENYYARSGLFSVRAAEDILYVDWILGVLLDWVRMVALTPFLFAPSPTPSPIPPFPRFPTFPTFARPDPRLSTCLAECDGDADGEGAPAD